METEIKTAYFVGDSDLIEVGQIVSVDGVPTDLAGSPLIDDGTTRMLVGWQHSECASYNGGAVLIPLGHD